jgi:apolipoprotein N-acyltransferase
LLRLRLTDTDRLVTHRTGVAEPGRPGGRRLAGRAALSVTAGLLLFAGHPPLDMGWVAPGALVPLLILARQVAVSSRRPGRVGFGWGFLAGAAFFAPLLYWIARFGAVPFVLLTAIQSLFVAVFVAGLAFWGLRPLRPAFAVALWVGLEAVRSAWPFGGFPWGVLGYTQHLGGPLLPVARTLGVLGVSAAVAGIAVCAESAGRHLWVAWRERAAPRPRGHDRSSPLAGHALAVAPPLTAALAILVGAVVVGGDPSPETDRTIDMAAVQGNDLELPPLTTRAELDRVERIVDLMVDATADLGSDPPAVTVWPENSLDADVRANPALQVRVDRVLDILDGRPLLAGELLDGPEPGTFQNGLVLYGPGARLVDVHVKRQLVPFGEYVPFRRWLEWYPALRFVPHDGIPGTEATVFDVPGARIAPITCYESLFPGLVRDQVAAGAEVLVVSNNNASYGRTAASAQHVAFSRLRAVETGRWVLHAGISGISAVVDPTGRSSQETGLFERAIVRAELPLVEADTTYVRTGDLVGPFAAAFAVLALVGAALSGWYRRRRGPVI